jgi:hypothetical protein
MKKIARQVNEAAYMLLVKINASPSGALPTANMSKEEHHLAKTLEQMQLIALVPANHGVSREVLKRDEWGEATETGPRTYTPISRHLPERYVITINGNYELESFHSPLSRQKMEWDMAKRRKDMERRRQLLDEWNSDSKPLGDF